MKDVYRQSSCRSAYQTTRPAQAYQMARPACQANQAVYAQSPACAQVQTDQSACQMAQQSCQTNQCGFALAMSYVVMQPWEQLYDLKTGLCRGTVFPGLDKPFMGKGVCRRG